MNTNGTELFDEFFESGLEESISPFLTPSSRGWGKNIRLKSALFSAFLLLLSYLFSFIPNQEALSNFFLLLTYFFAGIPALIASIEDLFDLDINIDVLMTLAAFLSILIGSGKEGGLLLVLFSFSGAMESAVRTKAKGAISALKKLAPQKAYVVQPNGTLVTKSVKDISKGTHIHIKAGEVIPLDGTIIEGTSSINFVHLTGENLPLTKTVGDTVPAGGRNLDGALTLSVSHISSDSTLSRIIQLVTQAQASKPKLQQWFDRASRAYALSIISLAFLFGLTFPWFFSMNYLGPEGSIYRALAFLIAASPCALIIAIPIAYLSAISSLARQGILLKGGIILDTLAKCKTFAMDKTGTLTTGELSCLEIITSGDKKMFLSIAYALERSAVHPIAKAIITYAEKENVLPTSITDFRSVPGFGLEGKYKGKLVRIGNPEWLADQVPSLKEAIEKIQAEGDILTIIIVDEMSALFRFRDLLRPKIKSTLNALKLNWGMRLVMLTGDHERSARLIAKEAGITKYYANLRPEDKLDYISKQDNLAMVGDGINDAPALARASVGISMGRVGSGAAIDASDIVLLHDNIELIEWLVKKSHQVVRIVKQNVLIAALAIVCATLPALLGWIPLWLAVVLHEGGTVIVGLNALRLLYGRRASS